MIIGSMVIKNEIDRYLEASLTKLIASCQKVFVADDGSDDGSAELAEKLGAKVWRNTGTSFKENESVFRQAAWDQMAKMFKLKETDWVLSLDADEYFIGNLTKLKELLKIAQHRTCFSMPIPEVWETEPLQVRVDGFWRGNYNRRFAKYNPNLKFRDVPMGCGSVPSNGPSTELSMQLGILHFGYANEDDRQAKHDFYKSLPAHGHNQGHIDSIITKPKLEHLDINVDFWRGIK